MATVDRNNLVCYEENNIKRWEMVKDKDRDVFLMNLLTNWRIYEK